MSPDDWMWHILVGFVGTLLAAFFASDGFEDAYNAYWGTFMGVGGSALVIFFSWSIRQ